MTSADGVLKRKRSDRGPNTNLHPASVAAADAKRRLKDKTKFAQFMMLASPHSFSGKPFDDRVIKIDNLRILRRGALLPGAMWMRGGRVICPQSRFWEARTGKEYAADLVLDGRGLIASPGFIDVQLNGAFGVDFSSPSLTAEDVKHVTRRLLRFGCTAVCPTVVTSEPSTYARVLPLLAPRASSVADGAASLGAHCEGPFISETKFGAHRKEYVRRLRASSPGDGQRGRTNIAPRPEGARGRRTPPTAADPTAADPTAADPTAADPTAADPTAADPLAAVRRCFGEAALASSVRLVTLAPELPGAVAATRALSASGVVVSAGHTEATVSEAERAVAAGASLVTHLFNAMRPFHHRDPGLVGLLGSAALRPRFHYSIIADGVHVHSHSLAMAHAAHPEGLVLVTDAMAAMGLEDGAHALGDVEVVVGGRPKRARIAGTETLAGSVVSIDECVRNLRRSTGCSAAQALEAATLHPARVMGLAPGLGTLETGARADIVLLDDALEVQATLVGGHVAWAREGSGFARSAEGRSA
jgi:N-acetylglucosamine-6-phosphate deacetylase